MLIGVRVIDECGGWASEIGTNGSGVGCGGAMIISFIGPRRFGHSPEGFVAAVKQVETGESERNIDYFFTQNESIV